MSADGEQSGRGRIFADRLAKQARWPGTELQRLSDELVLGGLWERPGLGMRERRIVTLTMLAARGKPEFLREHVRGALAHGELTPGELEEIAIHVAFYGGWPVGNAMNDVIQEEIQARREAGPAAEADAPRA
jgi:4-carboxymuconolactone decarboxylase